MADPLVREIGRIEDMDGVPLAVGVDRGTVTIGMGDDDTPWQLTVEQADDLAGLLITALWQAARQAGENSG
jgi:hypothetical protein